MPIVKKKVEIETEALTTRVSKELHAKLQRYCAFVNRPWEERHEVIEALLAYAVDHDADFKKECAVDAPRPIAASKRKGKAVTAA